MYNRRHCYSHKSIDSAWQNLRRAFPSRPLNPPWSLILWSICFVLFSPMILFFLNFIHYSSCLKYIFQGEKDQRGRGGRERCCWMPSGHWHSRWRQEQPLPSSADPLLPVDAQCNHDVWPADLQLVGIVPKLNAERTPLFSKVKPPCCSIFFFASRICKRKQGKEKSI